MNILLPEKDRAYVHISPVGNKSLLSLDADEIKSLYKSHGAILFRGFDVNLKCFESFTDLFCKSYVRNESPGRKVMSQDGRVQTVNLGQLHFPLHPELSREPWQPDIAWFTCEQANSVDGETTVCDGIEAAKAFPHELRNRLLASDLLHQQPVSLQWCANFFQQANLTLDQLFELSDPDVLEFVMIDGELNRRYTRPMLHKPMFSDEWAYGNFLVFARRRLGVSYFPCNTDGTEIDNDLVDEIEEITNNLSQQIKWQKNDLLMLDNTRFMHGRNPIGDPENRRILTQFGYLSFLPENHSRGKEIWR